MSWIRRWLFQGKPWHVFLEAWGLEVLVLVLVTSVIQELPRVNIPASFIFLTQAPVVWAALRLRPSSGPERRKTCLYECLFAAGLRAAVFLSAFSLVSAMQVQAHIPILYKSYPFSLALLTACFLPFLLYRLLLLAWIEWRKLAEKSFLWMMVNTHLITVFVLLLIAGLLTLFQNWGGSSTAEYPQGLLANIVLEIIRGIIPRVGVYVVFIIVALAVFFLPTLLVSYLTSRRFVRRISDLAGTMKQVQQGNLGARVTPGGKDEVAQLQEYFNTMTSGLQRSQRQIQEERDKVDALLKNQRELSAVVSHELRTPLTVMRAYIEKDLAAGEPEISQACRNDFQILHHETLKLQSLVEDLFTLSQMDEHRLGLECAWTDGSALVARVLSSLKPVAWDNKRIDLSAELDDALPDIWADASRLEQVLSNLVQNAIRHTPPGGVIVLQAAPVEGGVEISVRDSGEGISAEDLPHIWERFYRGAQGSSAGRTGIGLSLVKELVEHMGGSVGVESQPGEGSRFWLRLPVQNSVETASFRK